MAGFSLRRRKFAPSGVALEASHEAAGAGLVAGFMFGPGSNSLIDLCGNQWVELFIHAHAVNPLTGKPALLCTNWTARMQLPNGLRLLSRTAGSVAISSRITGYAGGYPRRLQTQDDSMFRLARLSAGNQAAVHLFGSNVDISTTAPYYTTGQSVMGLSWDASHPTIKRGLYREGVLVGSSGTAPGSNTEDRYIRLDGGSGEVDWLFFFDRAVDQQALFDDPMALVRARRQVVYFDAGGAGGIVIDADVGDAAASGAPAGIIASTVIAAQVGGAAAAGLPAAVQHAVAIPATVGDAEAAGVPAGVSQGVVITAGIGNAEASGLPASLSTGGTIEASTGDAQAAGLTAGISAATVIAATRGDAAAAGLPAGVSQGFVIVAGVGGASASGRPANIAHVITITTTAGNAAAAGLTAAIEAAGGTWADAANASDIWTPAAAASGTWAEL